MSAIAELPVKQIGRKRSPGKLSRKQGLAISALVTSRSYPEAAVKCGVSEKTLARWVLIPSFAAGLRSAADGIVADTTSRLKASSKDALDTLLEVCRDTTAKSQARVAAARTILEYVYRPFGAGVPAAPQGSPAEMVSHGLDSLKAAVDAWRAKQAAGQEVASLPALPGAVATSVPAAPSPPIYMGAAVQAGLCQCGHGEAAHIAGRCVGVVGDGFCACTTYAAIDVSSKPNIELGQVHAVDGPAPVVATSGGGNAPSPPCGAAVARPSWQGRLAAAVSSQVE